MKAFVVNYYKIILWTLIIAYLCFSPSDGFKKVNISIPHLDKMVHFTMFYILGVFIQAATIKRITQRNTLMIVAIFYGLLIEFVQYNLIVSRSGDILDFIFDSLGLFVGIISFHIFPKFVKRLL